MASHDDRYQVSAGSLAQAAAEAITIEPAGRGRRFANYLIDTAMQMVLVMLLFFVVALFWGDDALDWLDSVPDVIVGVATTLLYYVPMEGMTGRTLGKLITRTTVVDADGRAPTIKQVLGRTLSRVIPFDALSFFGSDARGWHDSFSNTFVVLKR